MNLKKSLDLIHQLKKDFMQLTRLTTSLPASLVRFSIVFGIGTANNLRHELSKISETSIRNPNIFKIWYLFDPHSSYSSSDIKNHKLANYLQRKLLIKLGSEHTKYFCKYTNKSRSIIIYYIPFRFESQYPMFVPIPNEMRELVEVIRIPEFIQNKNILDDWFPRWCVDLWRQSKPTTAFYEHLLDFLEHVAKQSKKTTLIFNHKAMSNLKSLNPQVFINENKTTLSIESKAGWLYGNEYMDEFSEIGWIYLHLCDQFPRQVSSINKWKCM